MLLRRALSLQRGLARPLSTLAGPSIVRAAWNSDALSVTFDDGSEHAYHHFWLRDHVSLPRPAPQCPI